MPTYPRVRVAELPDTPNPTARKKEVDEALGTEAFGFNVYTARPGERLPWGYHSHPDHEELLYVIEGELAIETATTRGKDDSGDTNDAETRADESGRLEGSNESKRSNSTIEAVETAELDTEGEMLRITAGEALFVPPGAPQCARAVGETSTRVIAVGAPKDADSAVIAEFCPVCEATTDRTYDALDAADGDANPDTDDMDAAADDGAVYVLSCAECGTETDRFRAGPE